MSSTSREVMPSATKNATAVDAGSIREDMWNFGDEVGLYFSWLGTYTRALFAMSVS